MRMKVYIVMCFGYIILLTEIGFGWDRLWGWPSGLENAMENDNKKAVKQKAMFYWQECLKCHIKKVPTGFVNGIIKSDLENGTFYWFEDLRFPGKVERLFLDEIFDIKDYEDLV